MIEENGAICPIQTHYSIAVFGAPGFRATLLSACALREWCAGGCGVAAACGSPFDGSKKNKIIIIWKRYQISSLPTTFQLRFFFFASSFFCFSSLPCAFDYCFFIRFFFFLEKVWRMKWEKRNDVRKRAILSLYLIFYFVFKKLCSSIVVAMRGCRPHRQLLH